MFKAVSWARADMASVSEPRGSATGSQEKAAEIWLRTNPNSTVKTSEKAQIGLTGADALLCAQAR